MATQVQIRGTTQATQEGRTLASRELDVNTTDTRLAVHDGSTSGGMKHVNARDAQNQEFTYAAASGTDAITATYAYTPSAYQAGQKFVFKAANTITGSATFNANSLGAKTIKKKNVSDGSIDALSAGDIIQGGIYTLFYDGTDMLLESVDSGGVSWTYSEVTASLDSSLTLLSGVSGITEIVLCFEDLRLSTTGNITIQIGDAGGYETSGYVGTCARITSTPAVQDYSSAFVIANTGSAENVNGIIILQLADDANHWMISGNLGSDGGEVFSCGGHKELSETLTQIKVLGSTLVSGSVHVKYR